MFWGTSLTVAGALFISADPAPDAGELVRQVLASRRAIVRGVVELDSRVWSLQRESQPESRSTVWFDGESLRADTVRPYPQGEAPAPEQLTYREVRLIAADMQVYWPDRVLPGGQRMGVDVRDPKAGRDSPLYKVADPRLVGIVPMSSANLVHYQLERALVVAGSKESSVHAARWKEMNGWQLEYRLADGGYYRVWIVPEMGFSVVRIESDSPSAHVEESVECALTKEPASGIWFPSSCLVRRRENGVLTQEEQLKVRVLSFNKPIDPAVFTLAGLGIPPGVRIRTDRPERRGRLIWNGREAIIVPPERRRRLPEPI